MDWLAMTLQGELPTVRAGKNAYLSWQWRDNGILALSPLQPATQAVVLSAGIHGNETAPVELLNQLVSALWHGELLLNVQLLVILGHPAALRDGVRYHHSDLNRLFGGRHAHFVPSEETARAELLEQQLAAFFLQNTRDGVTQRFHYDLHTAIRGSHHLRFALLPWQPDAPNPQMLQWLNDSDVEALVTHRSPGGTFSHFSSAQFHAASCTLELGKALPFGTNDLSQFAAIKRGLWALVSGATLSARTQPPLKRYRVVQELIKHHDNFQLYLAIDILNFTAFPQGFVLAEETDQQYVVQHHREWILFPNAHVANGMRAGLMLLEE